MIFTIPFTPGDVHVTQETALEGVVYTLLFQYSQRENCYYLSVGDASDPDGNFIVSSIKVQTNYPLLYRWRGAASANSKLWPPGELIAFSTTADKSIAGLGDLGSRVVLRYATSDDPVLAGR